ncbi:MAG TPA: LytTR family DNA-binding domain-containing protein [Flavisolibacter sp.]|jgi:DNA-binding LytR/AlgR family response regulator|nr:LytTR family DNA-binding domain-containing protein [Flavisolibacter sp.]
MLRCIAIDDEELALELLEDNISKVPYLHLVGSFSNPLEAIKCLHEQKIDLVFLDIQMPGLTGLQFIESVQPKPMFILITAYEKYALDGYSLDVVDYLVKPVALERFMKACNKAKELHLLKSRGIQEKEQPYFFINVDYSLLKVVFSDIMWIEGLKDYVKIHLKSSNKPIVARMSIKALEEELPVSMFVRVQKSYIVSKEYVTAIRKNSVFIGNNEIPVGDNFKEALDKLTGK